MSWISDALNSLPYVISLILSQAITAGVTFGAVLGVLYAAGRYIGKKGVDTYFATLLADVNARHAATLARTQSELDQAKQLVLTQARTDLDRAKESVIEAEKARYQRALEKEKAKLDEAKQIEIEAVKAGHQITKAEIDARLAQEQKIMDAQLNAALESHKAGLGMDSQTRLKLSETRLPSYAALWGHMSDLSPRISAKLDRPKLSGTFRQWYYENGNGLFLSWAAMDKYLLATDLLERNENEIPDDVVRKAFSALRTQMKLDMTVYAVSEAIRQVGAAQTQ